MHFDMHDNAGSNPIANKTLMILGIYKWELAARCDNMSYGSSLIRNGHVLSHLDHQGEERPGFVAVAGFGEYPGGDGSGDGSAAGWDDAADVAGLGSSVQRQWPDGSERPPERLSPARSGAGPGTRIGSTCPPRA